MSRRKSAPAARGAARAAAAPQRGVYLQKPRSDVYVALLGVALGAMIIGCLLLVLLWGRYDYSTAVGALFDTLPAPRLATLAALPGDFFRYSG